MDHRRLYPKFINSSILLSDRERLNIEPVVRNRLQTAPHLVNRIELEAVLEGHKGCVNCLEWSENGRFLASGSDDSHVIIWDPFRRKKIYNLDTQHTGNIFSVKFLPKSGNSVVATGAADKVIYVFDINRNNGPIWKCNCHMSRVKRLATAPETPFIFWSAGEDGNILQLDIREHHKCNGDDRIVLVNLSNNLASHGEAKCLAVNPRRTEQIAVGASDTFARLYDRRMIRLEMVEHRGEPIPKGGRSSENIPKDCVKYFCPGHLIKNNSKYCPENKAITYLTFNADGTELLVNIGAEQIYLYDLNTAEEPVFLNLPEYKKQSEDTSAETPNKRKLPEHVEMHKKLGNEFLENEKYSRAIDQYSKAIQKAPDCPVLYLNRATALMRRLWYGDVYAALRDCHIALKLDPSYIKAHFRLARALLDLGRAQDADECLKELVARFPNYSTNHGVMLLNKDISGQLAAQSRDSIGHTDLPSRERELRLTAKDYKERFMGHCNVTTDIKEANFFGNDGNYIVAGSDDGNFFIWERPTNKIKAVYKGDMAIVNCVQPHPNICLLATSGIDHEVKIWSPLIEIKEDKANRIEYIDGIVESNQHKMRTDPFDLNATGTVCRSS